jgi:glycerol-3-phosphate dehydrogenase
VKSHSNLKLRLVKGSHIVYPRLHAHERAYLLQMSDGRVVFAIPFAENYTLIGTTDVEFHGDPTQVTASAEEISYLCRAASSFFRAPVDPSRVVWTYAGVRPLIDDGKKASKVTREYQVAVDGKYGEAPLLSLIGGKLTAYRAMSEHIVDKLSYWLVLRPAWTASEPLPGGDLGERGYEGLLSDLAQNHSYLAPSTIRRIATSYGRRAFNMLGDAKSLEDLGPRLVGDLQRREFDYLRTLEWAKTPDDILWRRTKLGLAATAQDIENLKAAFAV